MVFSNYLAPLHDFSDLPFRRMCQGYGAKAACVPLVSSAAIAMDESRISLIDAHADERNLGVQIFGNDAKTIGRAAGIIARRLPSVSWLNLNCGCPSTRTMNDGSGSAMLRKPDLIAGAISQMKSSADLPVSAKIRIVRGAGGTLALCRKIEDAGADFIIIHGRTTNQGYSGKPDWEAVRALKEELSVPVVGNGDVTSIEGGEKRVKEGYCDSYMVGRAAMRNPMLFAGRIPAGAGERFALLAEYASLCDRYRDATGGPRLRDIKIKAMNFLSGIPGASVLRLQVSRAASIEEILGLGESAGNAL
ncbi:tRNA-dihydrouridine synthase family protein [Candidatus Micrarchaeota archaeon]|nr:tRNA-dihydrouridine synthase family protein [Candidatus Micrarchaeota archaeon]